MGFKYSYGDFTTRKGGVTEGPSGGRKGKVGAVYSRGNKLPDGFEVIEVVYVLSAASKYFKTMYSDKVEAMGKDLELGYVIKLRGGLYIKSPGPNKFEIYKKIYNKTSKNMNKEDKKVLYDKKVEEVYKHLMNIRSGAGSKK